MLVQFTRVFFFCLCFGGFLLQCWELFVKFNDGTTNTITSNIVAKDGQLSMPRLSICLDPPSPLSRLSKLGLSPHSWNSNQLAKHFTGNISWPITSENNSDLFDRSTYSFEEVFKIIWYFDREVKVEDKYYYKVVRTKAGKCFTLLIDAIPYKLPSKFFIEFKNTFDDQNGRFRIFLHDQGMEILLVNHLWLTTKKIVHSVSPGTITDIVLQKHIHRKRSRSNRFGSRCQTEWSSLDYSECIDEFMEKIRDQFNCSHIFDIALNQSALTIKKPICTSFVDTKNIDVQQNDAFWSPELARKCPSPCDIVSYEATITETKPFGNNRTFVYVAYETLDTLMEEEAPVYDEISMTSAVGGSLGLFLGFSFLEMAFKLINLFQEHFKVQ